MYFELRKASNRGTTSITSDMMRHLHTRQHLGKAVVICERPAIMMAAARKQWLKISRIVQTQRAGTLNADHILKYTHTITHMQHMQFAAKSPIEEPDADVYFLRPDELIVAPGNCYSAYITVQISPGHASALRRYFPAEALLVDYDHTITWEIIGLLPKSILEDRVENEWEQVQNFLQTQHITITEMVGHTAKNVDAMDNALDTLLAAPHQFLQVASDFQRSLELARPLRTSKDLRKQYDALVLLAHRVQALCPNAYTQQFLESYNEDDTFFLFDSGQDQKLYEEESLAAAIARHTAAGRHNLAGALQQYRDTPSPTAPSPAPLAIAPSTAT